MNVRSSIPIHIGDDCMAKHPCDEVGSDNTVREMDYCGMLNRTLPEGIRIIGIIFPIICIQYIYICIYIVQDGQKWLRSSQPDSPHPFGCTDTSSSDGSLMRRRCRRRQICWWFNPFPRSSWRLVCYLCQKLYCIGHLNWNICTFLVLFYVYLVRTICKYSSVFCIYTDIYRFVGILSYQLLSFVKFWVY